MPYVCVSDWGSNGDGVLMPVYPIESIRKGFLNRPLPVCVGPLSGGNPGAIADELIKFGGQAQVVAACRACKHGNTVLEGLSAATSVKAMVAMDVAAPKPPARKKPVAKRSAAKKGTASKGAGARGKKSSGPAKKAGPRRGGRR